MRWSFLFSILALAGLALPATVAAQVTHNSVTLTWTATGDDSLTGIASQYDLRTDGFDYVPLQSLADDHRYFRMQETVNAGGAPSEQVIRANRASSGSEYRDETEGPHPIIDLRSPEGEAEEALALDEDFSAESIPGAPR